MDRRFTVEAESHRRASRAAGEHDLAAILSHVEERVVANDYTIRYNTRSTRSLGGYPSVTGDVREERRDQTVWCASGIAT